jgi:hypothetical protein
VRADRQNAALNVLADANLPVDLIDIANKDEASRTAS